MALRTARKADRQGLSALGHRGRTALAGWLAPIFPGCPPSGSPRSLTAAGYLAGTAAVALLAMARQSGVPAARTLWAEDGVVFYSQAVTKSFWRALVTPYNGYEQLVPRLGAGLARLAGTADASVVMAWGGAVGLAVLAAAVFHMARGHITSVPARALLALSMVLLPVAVVEMLDNFVNLPWWMFFASFWALLWRPRGRAGMVGAFVLCGLGAASEPLVGLLVPLAAARVLALPRWRDNAATAGLVSGLVFQAAIVVTAPATRGFPMTGLPAVVPAFFLRVGVGWWGGLAGTDGIMGAGRLLAALVGAAVLFALLGAALVAGGERARRFAVAVAVLAPLCFVVPSWLRGAGPVMQSAPSVGFAGRYAATPMLMVISAVLVAAAGPRDRRTGRAAHHGPGRHAPGRQRRPALPLALVACCAVLAPAWVVDYRDRNGRSAGPAWAAQVAAARALCGPRSHPRLVRVPIDPPGAVVVLPCRALVGTGAR